MSGNCDPFLSTVNETSQMVSGMVALLFTSCHININIFSESHINYLRFLIEHLAVFERRFKKMQERWAGEIAAKSDKTANISVAADVCRNVKIIFSSAET